MGVKTINSLVKELCKREGLKKSVDISQVREIVGHLSDIFYGEGEYEFSYATILYENGHKRFKKANKRNKK